ncbi:hypothetical protein JL09_g6216 [Pichia kudriavzevii]|uniref:Uncharacterized protein n=1 Tax=Pichia kudriavzevii TaxID=4909 RepID=A0A099NRV7_PICKU|nr:hypothetical protein JL09_g6216 [Pichia kudriavzevii]
MGEIAGYM